MLERMARVRPGPAWAFPLGMAFAAGWTPCIGPVLGAIYGLASIQGSTARAILLLFMYSLGLGIPFVLIGLGIERVMGAMKFFSRNYHWFAGPDFWPTLSHGLVIGGVSTVLEVVVAVPLALLLNERLPARGLLRGLVTLPWAVPTIAVATAFLWLADPSAGIYEPDPRGALPARVAIAEYYAQRASISPQDIVLTSSTKGANSSITVGGAAAATLFGASTATPRVTRY